MITTLWARTLLHAAARCGVRDVVVSPGSRSTPFVAAALAEPGLECRAIVDERSAAFFAVGQAKVSGRPTLLIATSGSAGANYYPAVCEAAASHTPLLVLTADRPTELHDAEANQTMDQSRLFGSRAIDLGPPDAAALRALPRRVAQAVLSARHGPVHVNAPARKPLEPVPFDAEIPEPPQITPPRRALDEVAIGRLATRLASAERGLVVCGTLSPAEPFDVEAVAAVARKAGLVVAADATGPARFRAGTNKICDMADWLMWSPKWRRALRPDCVLAIGSPPLSSAWEPVLSESELHVVAAHGHPDPTSTAQSVLLGDLDRVLRALAAALPEATPKSDWQALWQRGALACHQAIEESLDADTLSEPAVVRLAVERTPDDGLLFIGNSLPPREANLFCRARANGPRVVAQRGLSGIDGLVSGAAGAALAARQPTTLLLGDVSFLHDVGGLLAAQQVTTPLCIVVVNNGGGRIFEQLPVARSGVDLSFWTTPQALDLSHAAALYGHRFFRPETPAALASALDAALAEGGTTVVEARVAPFDPSAILERIAEAAA